MPVQEIPRVPEKIDFPAEEEKILKYWEDIQAFQTCLKQSKRKSSYSFYDGPPFATGLPHYGHILAGTIKDTVTRYAHQQGFYVERRFGWDTHGLPVEFEIDKALGIKGPDDVMKMGIEKYNAECRKIVMRYAKEWEQIMGRIGRWIDFKNDYKTLYPSFMESVWWVFKQFYSKGLVYQGNKVMPYSTLCNTPLSNFESGQNYKDVIDPAVTVSLPIIDSEDEASLLVWTTTPWTLPSNLSACVHPSLQYVLFKQTSTGTRYIMLESRIESIFQADDYDILKQFPGSELKGLRYKPLFSYFGYLEDNAFVVVTDEYVTADYGTGVVHLAPYFGEDDYRVCLQAGIITKDQDPICPLDASGRFLKPVTDFEGQYVKDADKNIIAALKANGRLILQSKIKHSYPFCWRSDTPLIYKAVRSWFVRVEHMTDELQKASAETYWVPDFVKEKRFGNWLKEARDWAVSRNRYWGTPIPIWVSPSGDEIVCVGSIAELEELTGQKITDLHRESIDDLEIPSRTTGNPPLKRVPEVFDCWFESGSMPYGQKHYPFENVNEFDDCFPADFIAEGIDQTRGWFYTLLVISTALFGTAPYKNLIANGLVLARDGQKMSKRKRNYPDPLQIVTKYGADALRLYLINSPVVRAENLRFKEEGVRDILKNVFLPWYNSFRFLLQNIESFVQDNNQPFFYNEADIKPTNIMDQWILSFTHSLLKYVRKEMSLYRLYTVVPRLTKFIDSLTNWYVRMNRTRLKGDGGLEDCKTALLTLFDVLLNIVKMMAPFSPFLTDNMYQYLKKLMKTSSESVHYLMLPQPNKFLINTDIERAVSRMQRVIELGRVIRDRKTIPIRYPLPEIIIIHQDPQYIADIAALKEYINLQLNVRTIYTTTDKCKYGITLRAEPNYKVLGTRLKLELKKVVAEIQALNNDQINEMMKAGVREIAGQRIDFTELRLIFKCDNVKTHQYEVHSDNDVLIMLDVTSDSSMQDEGIAREIVNRIQKLRKKAHLVPTDQVSVFYKATGELERVAKTFSNFIATTIKADFKPIVEWPNSIRAIIEQIQKLKDCTLELRLLRTRRHIEVVPYSKWVNVKLLGIEARYFNGADEGLILLEVANRTIKLQELRTAMFNLFGVETYNLVKANAKPVSESELGKLSGQTLYIIPTMSGNVSLPENPKLPFCKVFNFLEDNIRGTVILENPVGNKTCKEKDLINIINLWVRHVKRN